MPILDGHKVDADQIDSAKHRFIGMWRPPVIPEEFGTPNYERNESGSDKLNHVCPCGHRLNLPLHYPASENSDPFRHWHNGCFDEPQYVTLEQGG